MRARENTRDYKTLSRPRLCERRQRAVVDADLRLAGRKRRRAAEHGHRRPRRRELHDRVHLEARLGAEWVVAFAHEAALQRHLGARSPSSTRAASLAPCCSASARAIQPRSASSASPSRAAIASRSASAFCSSDTTWPRSRSWPDLTRRSESLLASRAPWSTRDSPRVLRRCDAPRPRRRGARPSRPLWSRARRRARAPAARAGSRAWRSARRPRAAACGSAPRGPWRRAPPTAALPGTPPRIMMSRAASERPCGSAISVCETLQPRTQRLCGSETLVRVCHTHVCYDTQFTPASGTQGVNEIPF